MKSKRKWSIQEDTLLKTLVVQGLSDPEIEKLMSRSKHGISHRRRSTLGVDMRRQWNPDEDARLARLLAQGKSLSEIGKLLNRTEGAVERRKERLGLKRVSVKLSKHNPADIAQLIKFKLAGWTHEAIAEVFDITAAYVSNLLIESGFKHFCGANRPKTYRLWTEIELHYLRKRLVSNNSRPSARNGQDLSKSELKQIYSELPHRSRHAIRAKIREITRYWITPQEQAERNKMHRQRLGVGMAKLT